MAASDAYPVMSIKKAPSLNMWLSSDSEPPSGEEDLEPLSRTPSSSSIGYEAGEGRGARRGLVRSTSRTKMADAELGGAPSQVHKAAAAFLLTMVTSAGGILMQLSKEDGVYKYNTATVPLLSELLKLCISCVVLGGMKWMGKAKLKMTYKWSSVVKYTVPSILYLFCNNLSLEALRYLKPSTYQILGNLRIVTTGLLTVVLLRRPLARIQWVALVLMTVGATTSQTGEAGQSELGKEQAVLVGYVLTGLLCCLASLAGVYTERVMKEIDDTIHWQNAQLYFFGVLFNAVRLTLDDSSVGFHNGFWMLTLTDGYKLTTWLVVCNLAFSGLLVSFIMKYVDVIAKNFATASAMFLTPIASLFLFGHEPTFALFLGAVIAALSLMLYYSKKEDMFNLQEPIVPLPTFPSSKVNPASPVPMPKQTGGGGSKPH